MPVVHAAVHVHSTWSYDGSWELRRIERAFRRRRRRIVLMTEHDRGFDPERWSAYRLACAQASSPSVLLMPGIEYSDEANTIHLLVWGDVPFFGVHLEPERVLTRVHEVGGVAVLAHPLRRQAWRSLAPEWLPLLTGIEMWSRKYDGWTPARLPGALFQSEASPVPFVGLDFHDARQFFPLVMALDVDGEPTESSVIAAMRSGRCRPRAFHLPLSVFTHGAGRSATLVAESARQALRRRMRR